MKTRTELIISLQNEVDLCFEAKKTRDNDGPPYTREPQHCENTRFTAGNVCHKHNKTEWQITSAARVSLKANMICVIPLI